MIWLCSPTAIRTLYIRVNDNMCGGGVVEGGGGVGVVEVVI